jgi:hypothetical protein
MYCNAYLGVRAPRRLTNARKACIFDLEKLLCGRCGWSIRGSMETANDRLYICIFIIDGSI